MFSAMVPTPEVARQVTDRDVEWFALIVAFKNVVGRMMEGHTMWVEQLSSEEQEKTPFDAVLKMYTL